MPPGGVFSAISGPTVAARVNQLSDVEAIREGLAAGAENATTLLPADIEGEVAERLRAAVTVEYA
jgi:hypothetical protein